MWPVPTDSRLLFMMLLGRVEPVELRPVGAACPHLRISVEERVIDPRHEFVVIRPAA